MTCLCLFPKTFYHAGIKKIKLDKLTKGYLPSTFLTQVVIVLQG